MAKFINHDLSLNTCVGKQARSALSFTGQKLLFGFEIENSRIQVAWIHCLDYFFTWENYYFFILVSDPWPHSLFFFLNGLKWNEKLPKVKNQSNCVPGQEKELLGCPGTRIADFQPRFSHHGAVNSQRGGRPWLLISRHIMVLLGLRLGTHTSTFKQKPRPVREAPVHLNKHLRD